MAAAVITCWRCVLAESIRICGIFVCGGLSGLSRIIVGQAGIPFLKERPERAVECVRPDLQQQVRAAFRPLHLLTFGKTFADDGVHRGLGQAQGDALTGAESFAIVGQASDVGSDIDGEFVRRAAKFPQVGVVHVKIVDVDQEELNDLSRTVLVAMPRGSSTVKDRWRPATP